MQTKEPRSLASSLHLVSEMVANAGTPEDLRSQLSIFAELLESFDLGSANALAVNAACNNVCAKILTSYMNLPLSAEAGHLVQKMKALHILPPIYWCLLKHISSNSPLTRMQLNDSASDLVASAFKLSDFASLPFLYSLDVDKLFALDSPNLQQINRNFGYAILDMEGNFIWCDQKSQRVFELQSHEDFRKNLFDLMIPFSRKFLSSKFGPDFFSDNPCVGSSKSFSYVVYSKTSMNQYLKCLKKLGPLSLKELKEKLSTANDPNTIYHQYLRTLTSRATVIVLKFTKSEFKSLLEQNEYKIQVTDSINQLVHVLDDGKRQYPRHPSNSVELEDKRLGRVDPFGPDVNQINFDAEPPQKELSKFKNKINSLDSRNQSGPEIILMSAILLETRYSSSFPRFDYEKMREDPIIKSYEERILKKMHF